MRSSARNAGLMQSDLDQGERKPISLILWTDLEVVTKRTHFDQLAMSVQAVVSCLLISAVVEFESLP